MQLVRLPGARDKKGGSLWIFRFSNGRHIPGPRQVQALDLRGIPESEAEEAAVVTIPAEVALRMRAAAHAHF